MRYLKLFFAFVKNNLVRDIMFRTHFFGSLGGGLVYFLMFILLYERIYSQVTTINGWNFWQVILLISVFQFMQVFFYMIFIGNISRIVDYIYYGNLDFVLIKPIDAQFFVSFRYFSFTSLVSLLPPLFLMVVGLNKLNIGLNFYELFFFLISFILAIVILYGLGFLTVFLLFWLGRIFSMHELFLSLFRFMQYPSNIYHGLLKYFLTFIFPVIFVVSVPTKFLLGVFEFRFIFYLFLTALISFSLCRAVWLLGLRRYSSASS